MPNYLTVAALGAGDVSVHQCKYILKIPALMEFTDYTQQAHK